jgi:hypothetical protein
MPGFMQVVRIRLEPGGHVLYDNGPRPAVNVAPGTYQVRATLRVAPSSAVYGDAADLTLTCDGWPTATITLRVPNPDEWGLRADIYTFTPTLPNPPPWPPFGTGYTYRGTWTVGAIYFWLHDIHQDILRLTSPYFSRVDSRYNIAPKWAAYWINPTASWWTHWAVKFTGRLHVPWSDIRVGVWHNDGVYVRLCSIDTGNSRWIVIDLDVDDYDTPVFSRVSGSCGGSGVYNVEVGYFDHLEVATLIFVIGPNGGNEAYIPTIDGALYCSNFDWGGGRCSVAWSFRPASPTVPYFVGTNYTPSTTADGGGSPLP